MPPDLLPEEKALLETVQKAHKTSEDYLKPYRTKCDRLYDQYRAYTGLKRDLRANPPDRDEIIREAQGTWGSKLVIPFAFSTVETILSRAISNRPRMIVAPDDEDAERNVRNMKALIDDQQARSEVNYEMKLEDTEKSGFIYGLGCQKGPVWERRTAVRRQLIQAPIQTGQQPNGQPIIETKWVPGEPQEQIVFDDWNVIDVDIADLFWDPFGYDADSLRYVIHRTWRDTKYVVDRITKGEWSTEIAKKLTPEDVQGMATGKGKYDEAMNARLSAAGFTQTGQRETLHEVWEYHDGERVITVLDRTIPVQVQINPAWHGQLPFSFFRPTTAGIKQLAGIGAIEPIADLLREMSTLRSQRRDNAALKLAQVFAISEDSIDRADMKFFPGAVWETHGEPRDFLYPIQVGDIPNSGYREEEALVGDIERTTGISDPLTGTESSGSASTATGAQLVQAAASIRITRQSRRAEIELIRRQTGQAVLLNQQRIVSERDVRIPVPPQPGQDTPEWQKLTMGPAELAGRYVVEVEGGSTAPKNLPEQINQARFYLENFANNPHIDQRVMFQKVLELSGASHPEAWLTPPEDPIPPQTLDILEANGVSKGLLEHAVAAARRIDPASGQAEGDQPQPQPAQNGNGGPPQ